VFTLYGQMKEAMQNSEIQRREEMGYPALLNDHIPGGIDLNLLKTEKEKLLLAAMKKQDLKLLHMLWKQGVKTNHPYLEHLFLDFEKGYIPA